jgi:hypothetical protein
MRGKTENIDPGKRTSGKRGPEENIFQADQTARSGKGRGHGLTLEAPHRLHVERPRHRREGLVPRGKPHGSPHSPLLD